MVSHASHSINGNQMKQNTKWHEIVPLGVFENDVRLADCF